jgi:hypothetical protein
MPRDDQPLHAGLTRRMIVAVTRRRWWRHVGLWALAAAGILLVAALLSTASLAPALSTSTKGMFATLVVAIGVWRATQRSSRRDAAAAIERVCSACRNLVITTEELDRHPERASHRTRSRIVREADAVLAKVRPGEIAPLRPVVLPFAIAVLLFALAAAGTQDRVQRATAALRSLARAPAANAGEVRVVVQPPAYARLAASTQVNPTRIEALAASDIRFELPPGWRLRFGPASVSSAIVARESGYFAVEPPGGQPRLIPLSVQQDRAPSVRITAPGKDLLLPDGSRTIAIGLTASDDLGLRNLEVRYTKVSGSGEHFEFDEGTLAAALTKTSDRDWSAHAALALPSLRLGPGDALVYRGVARDGRPGEAGAATSDTYFIEIAGPGQIALEGVDMPPELDRYAMSQQMIVVKLERLRSRSEGMVPGAMAEETASIAAEQRTVRADFVFLLGGHVEDEEEEAAQSHEIQEGRLENTARRDINAAISQMTRVEQQLAALDVDAALPPARAAVESLQRAFGRSRYLLRSLASTSRLDPSRRLTGGLEDAGDWVRTVGEPDVREGAKVRELMMTLFETIEQSRRARPDAARLRRAAELALSIDPASPLWQKVARTLASDPDIASLERVIAEVSAESSRGTISRTALDRPVSPLERAFTMGRRR